MHFEVEETLSDGSKVKRTLSQGEAVVLLQDLKAKTDPRVQMRLAEVYKALLDQDDIKRRKAEAKTDEDRNAIDAECMERAQKFVGDEVQRALDQESSAGSSSASSVPDEDEPKEQEGAAIEYIYALSVANMNLDSFNHLSLDELKDVIAHPPRRPLSFEAWKVKRFTKA
jgi:hypothetical protein